MARWDKATPAGIPDWFWESVETEATTACVEVEECDVNYRCWGDAAKPGILLIHGMHAHSHWWDFIAPHFKDEYYLVAMDLTGMGDSDYRFKYSGDTYVQEIVSVCDAAGLNNDLTVVAHSFGGLVAVKAVNTYPERFGGLVLVDSGIRHPDDPPPEYPPVIARTTVYPSREIGEARFRLQPPQPCENEYLLKYIAKHSLRPEQGGWTWKFDEDLPIALKGVERTAAEYAALAEMDLNVGLIYGQDSELFGTNTLSYMQELIPTGFPVVGVPNAQHHVFLDQPLAFVDSLRDVLQGFEPG